MQLIVIPKAEITNAQGMMNNFLFSNNFAEFREKATTRHLMQFTVNAFGKTTFIALAIL